MQGVLRGLRLGRHYYPPSGPGARDSSAGPEPVESPYSHYFAHVHLIRDQLLYHLHPVYALRSVDGEPVFPGFRRHM